MLAVLTVLGSLHADEPHEGVGFWQDFLSVLLDPAHILSELVFSVVFDVLIGYLLWGLFVRRLIIPRLRRQLHEEIDAEHHIEHTEDGGHIHVEHEAAHS